MKEVPYRVDVGEVSRKGPFRGLALKVLGFQR